MAKGCQEVGTADPNRAVPRSKNRVDFGTQTLQRRKRGDRSVAEVVDAFGVSYPNITFAIFKKIVNPISRKTLRTGKVLYFVMIDTVDSLF